MVSEILETATHVQVRWGFGDARVAAGSSQELGFIPPRYHFSSWVRNPSGLWGTYTEEQLQAELRVVVLLLSIPANNAASTNSKPMQLQQPPPALLILMGCSLENSSYSVVWSYSFISL